MNVTILCACVPVGSPACGGDVTFMFLSLTSQACPLLFILFVCLFLYYGPFNYISFHKFFQQFFAFWLCSLSLQWGAVDAEIKDPSDENTGVKGSPYKTWSRSVYCHACYAYCQGFLLHFFHNLSWVLPVLAVADTSSCVGLQNKIGHPAGCRFPCSVLAEYK